MLIASLLHAEIHDKPTDLAIAMLAETLAKIYYDAFADQEAALSNVERQLAYLQAELAAHTKRIH